MISEIWKVTNMFRNIIKELTVVLRVVHEVLSSEF